MRFPAELETRVLDALKATGGTHHIIFGAEGYRADGKLPVHRDGTTRLLHRYLYEILIGPVSTKEYLLRTCSNERCVNPYHYEVQPRSRLAAGRLKRFYVPNGRPTPMEINAAKTHCPHNHEYTPKNTYLHTDKKGCVHRMCRTCTLKRTREAHRRARLEREKNR